MPWTAYIDGGARGNPGPAGAGVYIQNPAGEVAFAGGFFLDSTTNNQAEYSGLLHALTLLEQAGADEIRIFSDSELMVRQVNGQYRVKAPGLKPLYAEAMDRFSRFRAWKMNHVYRDSNTEADALANQAMDEHYDIVVTDNLGLAGVGTPDVPPEEDLFSETSQVVSVTVSVTRSPRKGICEANLAKCQTFVFDQATPSGLCIEGCAAVIEAVLTMKQQEVAAQAVKVTCGKKGCGAVFEIRRGD